MRWPWDRRAEKAQRRRAEAEDQLEKVRAQWNDVRQTVGVTRYHRELNGWTNTVRTIFEGEGRRHA